MPLPDNEPQYWLRDSNGNLVGAFYLDANGDPAIVDENGNEASLESDGTWDVPAVSTDEVFTPSDGSDIVIWQHEGSTFAKNENGVIVSGSPAAVIDSVAVNHPTAHVFVGPGDYSIDTTSLSQSWVRLYNTTLEGVDSDRVTFTLADGSDPYAVFRGRDNATVENIAIDGNKANNAAGHGVEFNNASGGTVKDCEILDTVDTPVAFLNSCTDSTVVENTVSGAPTNLIRVVSDGGRVADNTASGGGAGGSPATNSAGINVQLSTGVSVSGNSVSGHAGHGITVGSSSSNCPTTANTIENCEGHGINYSASATDNPVSANTVTGCTLSGIDVDTVDGGTPQDAFASVSGNTCSGNSEHGIVVQNSGYVTVSGNTCEGNTFAGIQTNGAGAEYVTITGNTCTNNDRGIDGNTGVDQLVIGNTCVGNTTGQIVNIPASGVQANNQTA